MSRSMIVCPLLISCVANIGAGDDDNPHHELLYPVEVKVFDYVSRVGDAFFVNTRIATPDDFETVVEFYADKLGRELWDDRIRGVEGRVEHVRTFFVLTTSDYSITGIMDPSEEGDPPVIHMTITVDPTTDVDVPPVDDDGAGGDSGS